MVGMIVSAQNFNGEAVSNNDRADKRCQTSSPLSSPPSSCQIPTIEQFSDKSNCHTPSASPPQQAIMIQLQAQEKSISTSPEKTDQILLHNYAETLSAEDSIDPLLKHLTDPFNVEQADSPQSRTQDAVQGSAETANDFSWLPDFTQYCQPSQYRCSSPLASKHYTPFPSFYSAAFLGSRVPSFFLYRWTACGS